MRKLLIFLLIGVFAGCASTSDTSTAASAPAPGSDEFAIETTVLAVFNVISGPAGRRDWDRFEELFAPGARIMVTEASGTTVMTTKEYIAQATPKFNAGSWFAHPIAPRIDRSGDIAHVWSAYEGREKANQEQPSERGFSSIQMVRVGSEWKVQSILWQRDAAHPR